ncbi:MAG: hypothetical protein C7B45_05810 [Sulfobacillus acidophilus]|uniref:EAL domain-containing protein n=1 Tax=Sulfobacillus acidophilus TaxID=53633 RepID=A0A2T2WKE2_9FIRM|nr:MAG: hypothetical protein C7B45_05810 [Sulfobacillus acidophilus]
MGYRLWSALQPIVNLQTGSVLAHEALLRGAPGSAWESPDVLFAKATALGQRVTLEVMARQLSLKRLSDLAPTQKLFMNVDAHFPEIPIASRQARIDPKRVVLEISEQQPILTNPTLLRQVQYWRSAGHAIALDDYGAGYMGIGALLTLKPDLLKLDRVIIADLNADSMRQTIVSHIVSMCHDLGITLVAEGIETSAELHVLQELGVTLGQGYLLGRPHMQPLTTVKLPIKMLATQL